ncbi:hypothetical protein HMPREF9997_01895 [Corynebacterium durum F0235]|uniref:Uncharacterized protein n=1 Tax=Corynebacterium durum F0235 TaxID=1035195 RepID=L1MEP6_9CORY|nr:hypothetical protein HMPREF9997_01895 [Corynebacterium durum F0235]
MQDALLEQESKGKLIMRFDGALIHTNDGEVTDNGTSNETIREIIADIRANAERKCRIKAP